MVYTENTPDRELIGNARMLCYGSQPQPDVLEPLTNRYEDALIYVKDLEKEVETKDQRIYELEDAIEELTRLAQERSDTIDELEAQIEDLEIDLAEARGEL